MQSNRDLESLQRKEWSRLPKLSNLITWLRKVISPCLSHDQNQIPQFVPDLADLPPGVPQFAAFINSNVNFSIYMRFGWLRNRILLQEQSELLDLQMQLHNLDIKNQNTQSDPEGSSSRQPRDIDSQQIDILLGKIKRKLSSYDNLIAREEKSVNMRTPTTRNRKGFLAWIRKAMPLQTRENSSLLSTHTSDFISLASERQDGRLDGLLEDMFSVLLPKSWMQRLFSSPINHALPANTSVHYHSKKRIGLLTKMVVIFFSVALFTVPVFVLGYSNATNLTKSIVFGSSVLVCAVAITVCTRAKAHEVFVATAAYSALLVVFLGGLQTMIQHQQASSTF